MFIGLTRPIETHTVTVEGDDLEQLRKDLHAQTPPGFEVILAPVSMERGGARSITATWQRRDGITEIEADDRDALFAKVPEGHQLLSVRAV